MKYLIIIAIALFGAAQASVEYDRSCRLTEMSPRVKTGFQVGAYLGVWYEISRYEAANQTDFDCVMARYTANADGSVEVRNSGYFQTRFIEMIGRAQVAFPEQSPLPAKLTVTFAANQPPAIYWGMSTDYVNYAVVWSCADLPNNRSREQLWILSRAPTLTAAQETRVNQLIDQNQFVRSAIRVTNQNLATCRGQ